MLWVLHTIGVAAMDAELTREADVLLLLIYKEYCQRRKKGIEMNAAKNFVDDYTIQETIAPKWSKGDVTELCFELGRSKMLDIFAADNHAYRALLSSEGICYMEGRFKRGLSSVLEHMKTIRDFLPI